MPSTDRLRGGVAKWLPVWLLMVAVVRGEAQPPAGALEIRGQSSCSTCTIELQRIATVGHATDSVLMPRVAHLMRAPNGGYVAGSVGADQILVFDSAGALRRTIGRRGAGPGEFSGNGLLQPLGFGRGDSLHVLDGGTISIFSSAFAFGRSFNLAMSGWRAFIPLPNGMNVVAGRGSEFTPGSQVLHLVSAGGTVTRSFGRVTEMDVCGACLFRSLRVARDGAHFWVSHVNRYTIEQFDLTGQETLSLVVQNSPWHTPWTRTSQAFLEPPQPTVAAVGDLGGGRLLVLGTTTTSDWRAAPDLARAAGTFPSGNPPPEFAEYFGRGRATTLEVIDFERRQVIASRQLDGVSYFLIGNDLIARQSEDRDGIVSFEVFRVVVRG